MAAVGAVVGIGTALWLLPRYLRAASVLSQSAGITDPTGITGWVRGAVRQRRIELPTESAPLHVAVYEPTEDSGRSPVLLVHGIHPDGIDEPRLQGLARALTAVGHPVWTPYLPELAALSATPDTVTRLHSAAQQLAEHYGRRGIGFGVSVGGGLLLQAAARPDAEPPLHRVVTLGAHHDLARVARHYAGDVARDIDGHPTTVPPHPYGLWVLAHAHVGRLFAAEDVEGARTAIGAWIDEDVGAIARVRDLSTLPLSEEGRQLVADLRTYPVGPLLKSRLLAAIDAATPELQAVSPVGHVGGMRAEVLLLHGSDDPVVPPTELSWIAAELPKGIARQTLITPVLAHAEFPEGKGLGAHLSLLRFVAAIVR